MLVVTRRPGESVIVIVTGLPGHTRERKVSVVAIRGGLVRLGFESDPDGEIRHTERGADPSQHFLPTDLDTESEFARV